MTGLALTRSAGHSRPAAPVRLLHLGLGSFFRAHQAWYTGRAPDAAGWGYAAFSGRGGVLAGRLAAQEGLYTLVTRAADGDGFAVVSSLSRPHPADDHDAWLDYFRSPDLGVVTLTVTEAGYLRRAGGGLDTARPEVRADLSALRADPAAPVATMPARLVAGLLARRRAGGGAIALVPCDNVPANGAMAGQVIRDFARALDPRLAEGLDSAVSVVTTCVDRITPRPVPHDADVVREATGLADACPVVTEPFSEWVLSGAFPAGRPGWEQAGAIVTGDVTPFEHRKLWLLNGGHSLLAYAGSVRGHATVAQAVGDGTCRSWLEDWWAVACRQLPQPARELAAYRSALLDRFANPRIRHQLAQIGSDGSQKLPIRVLPVLAAERQAGRLPEAATRILAAWICCLRGRPGQLPDVRSQELARLADGALPGAARRLLGALDRDLAADPDVLAAVVQQSGELGGAG